MINEVLVKSFCQNICVLIQEIHEIGLEVNYCAKIMPCTTNTFIELFAMQSLHLFLKKKFLNFKKYCFSIKTKKKLTSKKNP